MRLKTAYGSEYPLHNPYFIIRERGKHHKAKQVILSTEHVDKMKDNGTFSLDRLDIQLSDRSVETEILFHLGDQSSRPVFYPISGVPRCLMEASTRGKIALSDPRWSTVLIRCTGNRAKAPTTPGHKKNATFDAEWVSLEAKKAVWRFSSEDLSTGKDPFELYGSPGYTTPGNVPSDTISKISQRYSTLARSSSNASMAFSQATTPALPLVPAKYLTPDDVGRTMTTSGSHSNSEDAEGAISEALLDPESENVRQQMLYLLYPKRGRPPAPKQAPPPPPTQYSTLGFTPPLYIPTIGFENRATQQRNIQEFVSASDQHRLGFYANTKHLAGTFEMQGDSFYHSATSAREGFPELTLERHKLHKR